MELPPDTTDEQLDQFNQKQLFVRDAMPSEWLSYAEELAEATESLWSRSDNFMAIEMQTAATDTSQIERSAGHARSYILLAGLALENALKGILVSRNPSLVNQGHLHGSIKSHKLVELARSVTDLSLTDEDRHVLSVCQDAIPYWGRYPVPLRYDGLHPKEAATAEFRQHFRELHFRLCKSIYDAIKDGWDSGVGPQTLEVRSIRYGDEIDLKKPFPWIRDGGE